MILFIDNYDSFVHNLARYFRRLGQEVRVVRNDQITIVEIEKLAPLAIVISPGPCGPDEAGICVELVKRFADSIPILGVCLGHQVIAAAFGGSIVRAEKPMHGRTSRVHHEGEGIFADVPNPVEVCRYHSLIVDRESLPDCLRITAESEHKTIMAIEHQTLPVTGVQFHPEAILTEHGYNYIANFLRKNHLTVPDDLPTKSSELVVANRTEPNRIAPRTIWNAANRDKKDVQ